VPRSAGKAKTEAGRPARGGPLCTEPRRANYTGSRSESLKLSRNTSAQTISERSFRAQPARFFFAPSNLTNERSSQRQPARFFFAPIYLTNERSAQLKPQRFFSRQIKKHSTASRFPKRRKRNKVILAQFRNFFNKFAIFQQNNVKRG
jgi:hypothetical protein